jgi:hypothetical protein
VFDLAWTHSQVVLRQINATQADAQLYGHLASSILYANAALRAEASVLGQNRRGSPGCGATPFPAMCRLCCCRLPTPPTLSWRTNWCRPTPIGG